MSYLAPRFLFRRHEILRRVRAGESFLEIGAGNLALSKELLKLFQHGLAVDFTDDLQQSYASLSPEMRARLSIRSMDFLEGSIAEKFDCVVACEVMEHVEDDMGFLEKVHGLLKPGGQAVISVPAKARYWSIHDELVGHVRRYEKAELVEKARAAGFTATTVIAYGFPWVNVLALPRVWLARHSLSERLDWDRRRQTRMSNHNQLPAWLSSSLLPVIVNRFTVYPFALFSRLFNDGDRSNGYVLTLSTDDAEHRA